jgi:hypothetical protein
LPFSVHYPFVLFLSFFCPSSCSFPFSGYFHYPF